MTEIIAIEASDALMPAVRALRYAVFVIEQQIPADLEVDDDDEIATHLVALFEGRAVGTLRMVRHGHTAKIGRMAVAAPWRKKGIGRDLMEFAAVTAALGNVGEITLAAQLSARNFYKRLGYVEEGQPFTDANLPHIRMRKVLPKITL
jgi:predicted GNAT family N-acyltransferase